MLGEATEATNEMQAGDNALGSFKLSFIVPGLSKCGTSTLCAMLAQHPQIAFSNPKEPLFFCNSDYENLWSYYFSVFPPPNDRLVFGEGSTFYSAYQQERQSRDAILKYFPQIKLIFIVRDPFQRIESSYREFHHSGPSFDVNAPFGISAALRALPALIEDSKYWTRINCYREEIPDERLLVIFLEDLYSNPDRELRRCFIHLGINPDVRLETINHLNAGENKYYDSKLLRALRNSELINPLIAKLPVHTQNVLFQRLRLRHKFSEPIQWDADSKRFVVESLEQDVRQFLRLYGKPEDYWQRFAKESSAVRAARISN